MSAISAAPLVQNYGDYREFLGDWFRSAKASNAKVSFRYIAKHLGLSSPNHFHLVITKQRHLSKATLGRMHKMLRLRPKEKTYLDVLHTEATTRDEALRERLLKRGELLRQELREGSLPQEDYALLANSLAWYMRMGALRFHGKTLPQISELVTTACPFSVREGDIAAALQLLIRLGTVQERHGKHWFELANLKTDWDFDDQKIKQFHDNNLRLAMASIPWPIDRRYFSNVTIPCTVEMVGTIKTEIRELCLRLLELSNRQVISEADCQRVMSLEFALFPYFLFPADEAKAPQQPAG